MKEVFEAIKTIREKHPKRKPEWEGHGSTQQEPIKGTITCPKCQGVLHYSISDYNNHIWGKCETKDCLTWMM